MIYQIEKCIGSMAAVLHGQVDGILLGGGMVYNQDLVRQITDTCSFIAPVSAYPGEFEMEAMAAGAIRVLNGEEKLKEFPDSKRYKKRMEDIKTLTFLYEKYSYGEDFSLEELKFIYEIDDSIEGFGFKKDPRIEEIIKSRYIEGDIQKIIDSIDYKNKKEAIHFYLPPKKIYHSTEKNDILFFTRNADSC